MPLVKVPNSKDNLLKPSPISKFSDVYTFFPSTEIISAFMLKLEFIVTP